jgi:Sulfotransferase domain
LEKSFFFLEGFLEGNWKMKCNPNEELTNPRHLPISMMAAFRNVFPAFILILIFTVAVKIVRESQLNQAGGSETSCSNILKILTNCNKNLISRNETKADRLSTIDRQADSLDYSWKEKMLQFFSTKYCSYAPSDFQPAKWLRQIVIMIGVQKGGTKAIHTFLEENPLFASRCSRYQATKEMFFFNNKTHLLNNIDQRELQLEYAKQFRMQCPRAVTSLNRNASKVYLDDTPNYMQDSHEIPQLINCVIPNSKMMAILRNPTDRAYSHYNFYLKRNWCTERTFDEWVDINIKELINFGIVDALDPYEELVAWKKYNDNRTNRGLRKCRTFVTRGLYAIQLLHFITALEAAGRSSLNLHVILSEELSGNMQQEEYDKVVNFLGLAPHRLLHNGPVHKTKYETTMNQITRMKLDAFFRPYNFRLYDMLGWDPVWNLT